MKILLTNDDGIHAPGLTTLANILAPDFEIRVVAPDRERSAVSHAVTFRQSLHPERLEAPYPAYAVDGTPADCVKLGVMALLDARPDFLVSGINRGINVGNDVLYSGTVAGALEGVLQGIPSVAVSLESILHPVFEGPARFVKNLLAFLAHHPPPPGVALNVNLPDGDPRDYKGIRWTRQKGALFKDAYREETGPDGKTTYLLDGILQGRDALEPGSDGLAVREGYVSVTPLGLEFFCREEPDAPLDGFPDIADLVD